MTDEVKAKLEEMWDKNKEVIEMADKLLEQNPSLGWTALIMAGDAISKKRADVQLENGVPFRQASQFVGSYSRLDWVCEQLDKGNTTKEEVFEMLPELWSGSDPDDSDPRFWKLWREAWEANGKKPIYDEKPLPKKSVFTIYRGQDNDGSIGIAWTLNEDTAKRFASGAALRQLDREGIVYTAKVKKKNIWAYLTSRGEEEVIVNPFNTEDL